ncbi:MAG: aspartate 1-decarboxylase [Candidatus Omnitrophota bacterium]
MFRTLLKSKIHQVTVTESNLQYKGSITIDPDLMDASDILPNEKVQVVNINNGARLETYVIPGKKGSGIIGMNGGAARHAVKGDKVLIMSYVLLETKDALSFSPKVIFVNDENKIVGKK